MTALGRADGHIDFRYEDVAQDGRVRLEGIFASLAVVWRTAVSSQAAKAQAQARAFREQGVIPILTRLEAEGTDGPFAVESGADVTGGYTLSHARDASGAVARILFDLETDLRAPIGRTNFPPPDAAGTTARLGKVFAEHVFTRPFAAPGERKVLALDAPGVPAVPGEARVWHPPSEAGDVPNGAELLDDAAWVDPVPFAFGVMHTDSNQHVNSMVYPRLFEEACLRRFAERKLGAHTLVRRIVVGFRRPSFSGETGVVTVSAFRHEGRLGAVCGLTAAGEEKARVYARLFFE